MVRIRNQLDKLETTAVSAFYFLLRAFISAAAGFLASKCSFGETIYPFSLILLSVSPKIGLIPTFCFLGSSFGYLTNPFEISVFKYISASTMIYVVYMVFQKSMNIIKKDTAILSALCCFTSGFLFLLVDNLSLFSVLLLICESVLICCCVYFVSYAVRAFKKSCMLSGRELIAASVTLLLVLISLQNLNFFGMNISRVLSFCVLFLGLFCLKTSHTALLGCCIGILLAVIGNGGEAIFSATIVGTLAGCIFSGFSERLSITSFVIAYYAVLFFYGKFPFHYWLFSEPPVAMALVFFVPKFQLKNFLSSYISVKNKKNNRLPVKQKDFIASCEESCHSICQNAQECYGNKRNATAKALSELIDQPVHPDLIEESIPYCIKPHAMAEVIYERQAQFETEDLDALTSQLNRISKKIHLKLQNGNSPIRFFEKEEKEIIKKLQTLGISVQEIDFIEDEHHCKKCNIAFCCTDLDTKSVLHTTIKPYFNAPFILKLSSDGDRHWAEIREKSKYLVTSSALCQNKGGEHYSGDSALGFSIDKHHYCLLLTDGMGSGKEAGLKSKNAVEIIKKLLSGGVSPQNTLNIYRIIEGFGCDDYFTTIDLCIINLKDGITEFYKAGAYDSFLIRGDKIKTIRGGGLPFGLTERDQIKHLSASFSDGDTLLMASDGISALGEQLTDLLAENKQSDVRLIAQKIMQSYAQQYGPVNDDITVIVSRFKRMDE
ncbi:MAG: SpoIIE family protein phosphatase [Clostridia bacterium]|nr:SpoIIE family protein phosphatase [Clostridia bacterium]